SLTFTAYSDNACSTLASDPFTIPDGVRVGNIFADSFGLVTANTVPGWTDGDAGGSNCALRTENANGYLRLRLGCTTTKSGLSTAGMVNIHLQYRWGQDIDGNASGANLVVQWKPSSSGTWNTLNTHTFVNNLTTSPNTFVDVALPASANNTTIDIRFIGNSSDDEGRARVDDVLVLGTLNSPPTVVLSGPTSANEGDTKTYTFTVNDPNAGDTYSGTPSCG